MFKSLVGAALLLGVALACAVSTTHAAVAAKQTMHITATQHDFHQVGVGKKGPVPGSVFVFSEKLAQNGKAIGSDHIVCTFVGKWPSETDFCRGLFVLPGGSIVAEGSSARGPFTVAITGGTGRYAGARGVVHATPTKSGELLDIVFG
jgi:Allene oxide cyclase barrel like domain